jgi:hypothetical protein
MAPQVVAGIKHLNHGLDVPHLLSQVGVLLLVLKHLAAWLGVQTESTESSARDSEGSAFP